ncbi:DUF2249 domain-containing protein [Sphingobacterium sp. FBM7-1]|uniref:DUF2249 domain-containing protein n=1 Tax=Sphingobacterium sp. FBM7-1 TaxID=2886688 RepID=UPI001D12F2EA|nr:DUF2249 domain-containing protein [Sphingobacterium sp. FBM7-1]MCC2598583.1 DUF2249 domain-containing protein [Sphingobacterium sp. FBM7-1]
MLVNERTKIATLLKHHPDALETIIKLSPDFKKLRNPILRTLMAGRTTIAMAAKIGGCKPADFFAALTPLGFEREYLSPADAPKGDLDPQPKPAYLQHTQPDQFIRFDVREILAKGSDPLKAIQQKVKSISSGQVLVIINSFEPTPLIKLLEKQGFTSYVNPVDTDTIETFFYKINKDDQAAPEVYSPPKNNSDDWSTVMKQYEGNCIEVDVRELEMPQPMMTILEQLETLPADHALYVHHKRVPVYLLEELKERAFDYRINDVQAGEVYLLIFRNK